MRRLTLYIAATFLLAAFATPAAAAEKNATISGTILHGDSNRPVGGARVTIIGANSDGSGRVFERSMPSARNGGFSFDTVPTDPGVEFALEASYDGGLFVGESLQLDESARATVDLQVWETTADPEVISLEKDHLFVAHGTDGAGVLESVTIINDSDLAYIGRGSVMGDGGAGPYPTLGFALPTQSLGRRVDLIDSSLNRLYAVDADFGWAATVAIPPGETTVTFAYPAVGSGGSYDLTRRALYPIDEFSVFVTEPLEVDSGRLAFEGNQDVGGDRYREWTSTGSFDSGDVIPILAIAEGSSSSVLWIGIGIGLVLILTLVIASVARRRPAPVKAAASTSSHEDNDLVTAIAELDLRHESGQLSDQQWSEARARLKTKLVESKQKAPTP